MAIQTKDITKLTLRSGAVVYTTDNYNQVRAQLNGLNSGKSVALDVHDTAEAVFGRPLKSISLYHVESIEPHVVQVGEADPEPTP